MLQAFCDDHHSNFVLLGGIYDEWAVAQTHVRNAQRRLLKECKSDKTGKISKHNVRKDRPTP